jgi:hypothetical protein
LVFLQEYHDKFQTIPLFIYDLGLVVKELNIIRSKYPQTTIRTFNFANFPPYFNISVNAGEYAWKPLIVKEMLDTTTSAVLWLDSGDRIASRNDLENAFSRIEKYGHVTAVSSGTTKKWVYPATLEFLKEPGLDIRMSNAAIVGFDMRAYRMVVKPWAECALERSCIAPIGSNRGNHRQDQAVLTVLLYKDGRRYEATDGLWILDRFRDFELFGTPGGLGIKIHQDVT